MRADDVVTAIEQQRVVPVVRAPSRQHALEACDRLMAAGLSVVEITTTIPEWADLLVDIREVHPTSVVGIGTITDAESASLALRCGAQFLVSPFPVPEVRKIARDADTLFIGGGFTPAEVFEAAKYGLCKLFPAHVGGPAYLKSLKAILPDSKIMPTGGISLGEARHWFAAGAFAIGVGSDLTRTPDLVAELHMLRKESATE